MVLVLNTLMALPTVVVGLFVYGLISRRGPLGEAGFEVSDVVLEVNGQPINSVDDFSGLMSTVKPGQKIAVLALDHRSSNAAFVEVVAR